MRAALVMGIMAAGAGCGRLGFDPDDNAASRCQVSGFAPPTDVPIGGAPRNVEIADVDKDGARDVVATEGDLAKVSVVFGTGDGTFAAPVELGTGVHPWSVGIGDVTGDGITDLVIGAYDDNLVTVYPGQGGRTFGPGRDYATALAPQAVALADLDGDGRTDVVVAAHDADAVSVLIQSQLGILGAHADYPAGAVPYSVATGDLDRDGVLDLAVASPGAGAGGSVTTLRGLGGGLFAAPVALPIVSGIQPWHVTIADLDGDTALDVVVANNFDFDPVGQTVSVFLGNGDGTFAPRSDLPATEYGWWVRAVDLDGDGALDLAVAGGQSNTASVFHGNGDGTFAPRVDFPSGTDELAIATGDLDGDGKPDLAVAAQADHAVVVHRSTCTP